MKKRELSSILLALCMVLALLPTAWAAEAVEFEGEFIDEAVCEDFVEITVGGLQPVSVEDGLIELKPTNEVRYIDRVVLPDYALTLYETLEEAADGDGYLDYLIDGDYFDPSGENIYSDEPGDFVRLDMRSSSTGITARYTGIIVTSIETAAVDENTHTYVYNCIRTVYAAFRRDHPEVFWLNGVSYMRYIRNGKNYYCYVLSRNSETSDVWEARKPIFQPGGGLDLREVMAKRDADVEKILRTIPAGADRFTQIYYLNKWLTENNEYNTIVASGLASGLPSESIDHPWDSTLCISALAGQEGTAGPECVGYAQAFQVLCDALDIPCVHVRCNQTVHSDGSPGSSHSWNYVQMEDGKWYAVDVTANDPSVSPSSGGVGKLSGRERTDYLLVGGKTVIGGMEFLVMRPPENPFSTIMAFPNGPVLSNDAFSPHLCLNYAGILEELVIGSEVNMTAKLTYGADGVNYRYSVYPSLPAWLTLDPDTGAIIGIVTDASDAVTVTVTAANPDDPADCAECVLTFPAVERITYTITAAASPAQGGTVTGSGTYEEGESVTVRATPASGYKFVGWTEDGRTVNTNSSYTFPAAANRTLTAVFERDSGGTAVSVKIGQVRILPNPNGGRIILVSYTVALTRGGTTLTTINGEVRVNIDG